MTVALASKFQTQMIGLRNIQVDHEIQSRASMHLDEIHEFSEAMISGSQFPPIDVFWDGNKYWLADGFHRHEAARKAGLKNICCTIRDGSRNDAIVFSAGANKKFSIKRTDADVRKAIKMLLEQPDWFAVSSAQIAAHVGCASMTASKVREQFCQETKQELPTTFQAINGRHQPSVKISRYARKPTAFSVTPKDRVPNEYDLEWTYIRNLFTTRFGFKAVIEQGKAMLYPGIRVLHHQAASILVTPCDFSFPDALPQAIGRLSIASQMIIANRTIVLAYRDHGPSETIALCEELGFEFASPDEVFSELKQERAKEKT